MAELEIPSYHSVLLVLVGFNFVLSAHESGLAREDH